MQVFCCLYTGDIFHSDYQLLHLSAHSSGHLTGTAQALHFNVYF